MSARPRPHGAAVPFVGKPIDIDKLLATVEEALARRAQAREARQCDDDVHDATRASATGKDSPAASRR
jgi:DNA-binding NtrC family response regulator